MHEKGECARRHLARGTRMVFAQEACFKGPSTLSYEKLGSIDPDHYKAGNLTEPPNACVLRKAADEFKKRTEYSSQLLQELILIGEIFRKENADSQTIKGYVQCISCLPFHAILYSEKQENLFV